MFNIEQVLLSSGIELIAGVDEAGRGPCAGPLVVAAVILANPLDAIWSEIQDSKKLSKSVREKLFELITYAIVEISVEEIDCVGLHRSNLAGMRRAVLALDHTPDYVLSDGYPIPGLEIPSLAVWKGDQVSVTIGAASILAKVYRDRIMTALDADYPMYGLSKHKGYITAAHSEALLKFGPSVVHRRSFSNIQALL
jgi:ribonuclease HII